MRQRGIRSDVDDVGLNADSGSGDGGFSVSARKVLKNIDVYPKMHREFRVQTTTGAAVSFMTGVIMLILFLSELRAFLRVNTHEHMAVDTTINEKLRVNMDISFLAINCKDAHLSAMDVAGELQLNMHQTIVKSRLDIYGNPIGKPISVLDNHEERTPPQALPEGYCGSCYNAVHPAGITCCNTCDQVKEAFMASDMALEEAEDKEQCRREALDEEYSAQEGEGCRFRGWMFVNRVAGNFHVALGQTFHREGRLVHQFRPGQEFQYNASHIIHSLSFGDQKPGIVNPLDGVTKISERVGAVFQYYIKIVPTIYSDISSSVSSYQFSYTQQARYLDPYSQLTALPGTFFVFDLSPFMVKVDNERMPFTHFLTRICAIIGGMVSIAGFVDSVLYSYRQKLPPSVAGVPIK